MNSAPLPQLPDYAFGQKLGAGSYGTVYKARLISSSDSTASQLTTTVRPTTNPSAFYAVKCIYRKSLTKTYQDLIVNEIALLKNLKHENIVEMHDFRWDGNYIYIIMEYCSGGDLSMFLRTKRRLSETRARVFLKQIACALRFLHVRGISHMDLKPENILLKSIEQPIVKVADFGVAQHIEPEGGRTIRGTLTYMAPEILSASSYDNRVDLWSIGVILFECLYGRLPFSFQTVDDLITKIQSNIEIKIPDDGKLSKECRDLLEKLLKCEPNQRISFDEFFSHPFLFDTWDFQMIVADDLLEKSIEAEKRNDLKTSLDFRVQALDEYLAILKSDHDIERRKLLKNKIQEEVRRAEMLKKRIFEQQNHVELSPDFSPSDQINQFKILFPSSTSAGEQSNVQQDEEKMADAFQNCIDGNRLFDENQFAEALHQYETGLTVMLDSAKKQTDEIKRKYLYDAISHFLKRAEQCKEKVAEKNLENELEKIKNDPDAESPLVNERNDNRSFSSRLINATCPLQ